MLKAYGIFEGGGAKGLAHVGALKAAEEYGVKFVGVAGASAGAIVASLIACGYNSDELFDPSDKTANSVFNQNFINLLGKWRWKIIKILRWLQRSYRSSRVIRIVAPLLLLGGLIGGLYLLSELHAYVVQSSWTTVGIALFLGFLVFFVLFLFLNFVAPLGLLSTHKFENWLNSWFLKKVTASGSDQIVRFKDIDVPLKLIVTNVRQRAPVEFSRDTTPEESVAKAVAYSMSIPLAFKPHFFEDSVYVDGGVLSNFPAWVFDDQRAKASDIVSTIGFRLYNSGSDQGIETKRRSVGKYLKELSMVFFGDSKLQIREIDDLHLIPIKVSASTLDFDLNWDGRRSLYNEGYYDARQFFGQFRGRKNETTIVSILKALHDEMIKLLGDGIRNLRVNIAQPVEPMRRRIRVLYHYNMHPKDDCDDRLDLSIIGGAMGRCWQTRLPILVNMTEVKEQLEEWNMTKYEQALVRPGVKTLISIPIFQAGALDITGSSGNNEPLGVLNIDSDSDVFHQFVDISGSAPSNIGTLVAASINHIAEELVK